MFHIHEKSGFQPENIFSVVCSFGEQKFRSPKRPDGEETILAVTEAAELMSARLIPHRQQVAGLRRLMTMCSCSPRLSLS
jgi:hypothetical protein